MQMNELMLPVCCCCCHFSVYKCVSNFFFVVYLVAAFIWMRVYFKKYLNLNNVWFFFSAVMASSAIYMKVITDSNNFSHSNGLYGCRVVLSHSRVISTWNMNDELLGCANVLPAKMIHSNAYMAFDVSLSLYLAGSFDVRLWRNRAITLIM